MVSDNVSTESLFSSHSNNSHVMHLIENARRKREACNNSSRMRDLSYEPNIHGLLSDLSGIAKITNNV